MMREDVLHSWAGLSKLDPFGHRHVILVDVATQDLTLLAPHAIPSERATVGRWTISTSRQGSNCHEGSFGTPTGWHQICAVIGRAQAPQQQFVGRVAVQDTDTSDAILGRILWLDGLEPHHNRYGSVDSRRRYIYVHGTRDTAHLGQPYSQGCVRMHPLDVVQLAELVKPGALVWIGAVTLKTKC